MRVVCPLPARDFDPSEAAVSWKILRERGHDVIFASPLGERAECDAMMLSGEGLDPWGRIPGLRKLRAAGLVLRANREARDAYARMSMDAAFRAPLPYADLDAEAFDALLLPGGHRARGMRDYLGSVPLQRFVADTFDAEKPVAAICHGVLLAARSISQKTGRSVLFGRKTTALTWRLESQAWKLARRSRWWDPDYYRTYGEDAGQPFGYNSVQAEVTRALAAPEDFLEPAPGNPAFRRQTNGIARDSATDATPAFVVRDGVYVSGRWPGDAHAFAATFVNVLDGLNR
jgi:putative intracellular protease/amidase